MKVLLAFLLMAATLCSCGGYSSGTMQKSEKSYLKFIGNVQGISIAVDEGTRFPYDRKIEQYEVSPGRHAVKVYRNETIVVDRMIFVDDQTTFEIEVP